MKGFQAYVMLKKYKTYYHFFGLKVPKFWPHGNRSTEHMKAAENTKWSHSGLTQHIQHCNGTINGPQILESITNKNKNALKFDLRVREALYIRRFNAGPTKGMNEDMGSYVKTSQWTTVFDGMKRD